MGANTNFATWDSRHYQGGSGSTTTFSEGNCRVGTTSGGYPLQISNFAFPATGKYYIELNNIVNNNYHCFGIVRQINVEYGNYLLDGTGAYQYQAWNGQKRGNGGSAAAYGSSWTSVGDVIGLAFDADNGKIWWAKNGTWQASGDPAAGSNEAFSGLDASQNYYFGWSDYYTSKAGTVHINCGQDSSFSNSKTSGSANATDSNGFGDFYYTPPTGFLALGSASVPVSDDIDPAGDDGATENPTKQFNTVLFDGNGTTNAVTGLGFKPDLIWGFTRNGSQSKRVIDSTRGGSERLYSDLGSAASTGTATISAFGTDGFTATGGAFNNDSGKTCGSWCWKANGGTTTSFSAGGNQLAGTYQANTKSKFSIITYTGSGSANSEVLHGLGATPNFIIFKARNDTHWWGVYHKSGGTVNTGYDSLLYLNSDNALASGQNVNIVPDSTKIVMSGNEQINRSSSYNYVMYAWADVEGMQKFGTYEGNSNANGPFVYTGFRPRMLFTKRTESAGGWRVRDTARDTYNPSTKISWWDSSSIEYSNSDYSIDILSNGFKIRTSSNDFNASEKWIYGAWGDVPFKYNNTF